MEVFGGFRLVLARHPGFYRFLYDLGGFGSILGQFWGAMLEPFWKPKRVEIGKMSNFVPFFGASKRHADFQTILG